MGGDWGVQLQKLLFDVAEIDARPLAINHQRVPTSLLVSCISLAQLSLLPRTKQCVSELWDCLCWTVLSVEIDTFESHFVQFFK